MKRFTMNMTLAVAAVTLAAGTVLAQTMKEEIPFAFRVGKQVMQPGSYQVSVLPGASPIIRFFTFDVKQAALAVVMLRVEVPKDWLAKNSPKLQFVCGEGACTLNEAWMGDSNALQFYSVRGRNGKSTIAEITMHR